MGQKKHKEVEIAGWRGTVAILPAYVLASYGLIAAKSTVFQLVSLTGAVGIITISIYKNVRQSLALNVFWTGDARISPFVIVRLMSRGKLAC